VTVKNLEASVQARLQNHARATKRPFQELLQYYAMERFLYRLSKTPHRARLVLKGPDPGPLVPDPGPLVPDPGPLVPTLVPWSPVIPVEVVPNEAGGDSHIHDAVGRLRSHFYPMLASRLGRARPSDVSPGSGARGARRARPRPVVAQLRSGAPAPSRSAGSTTAVIEVGLEPARRPLAGLLVRRGACARRHAVPRPRARRRRGHPRARAVRAQRLSQARPLIASGGDHGSATSSALSRHAGAVNEVTTKSTKARIRSGSRRRCA
jgi:hypothetical protein